MRPLRPGPRPRLHALQPYGPPPPGQGGGLPHHDRDPFLATPFPLGAFGFPPAGPGEPPHHGGGSLGGHINYGGFGLPPPPGPGASVYYSGSGFHAPGPGPGEPSHREGHYHRPPPILGGRLPLPPPPLPAGLRTPPPLPFGAHEAHWAGPGPDGPHHM